MIDWKKIDDVYIPYHKKNKPKFLRVSDEQWIESLDGIRETASNCDWEKMNTEVAWNHIYFCAMYFCKGYEYAEVQLGKKEQSNYPVY